MENLDCFGVSILIPSGKGMRSVGCPCELQKQYVMSNTFQKYLFCCTKNQCFIVPAQHCFFAGSLESANSSILAARRHFKEVVGKKIRILL